MANRMHIRGAQVVTMDETLGDFATADIVIENGVVTREWTTFNEFGVLMQLHR